MGPQKARIVLMSAGPPANDSRRGARASWPIRRFKLGSEPHEDLRTTTTAEERLAMVESLTSECWPMTGQTPDEYSRQETPISFRPWPSRSAGGGR
jgi:hypothetical protein